MKIIANEAFFLNCEVVIVGIGEAVKVSVTGDIFR